STTCHQCYSAANNPNNTEALDSSSSSQNEAYHLTAVFGITGHTRLDRSTVRTSRVELACHCSEDSNRNQPRSVQLDTMSHQHQSDHRGAKARSGSNRVPPGVCEKHDPRGVE